jgi:glycine oxidase
MCLNSEFKQIKHLDAIVVGAGIAGAAISARLFKEGKTFVLIHSNGQYACASHRAAGLVNPITGKNYNLSWNFPRLLTSATELYQYISNELKIDFFQSRTIYRSLIDTKQLNDWDFKRMQENYAEYMASSCATLSIFHALLKSDRIGPTLQSYQCKVKMMLGQWMDYLSGKGYILEESFIHERLVSNGNIWIYDNFSADKVFFCEGTHIKSNVYFNYLPIKPNKGEAILVRIPELPSDFIIKQQVFIAPWDEVEKIFWVGSNYQNSFDHQEATEEGIQLLLEHLKDTIQTSFEYLHPIVGVRPTVPDRRPLIGEHPVHRGLFILNGLGTKGLSLAPYCSEQLYHFAYNNRKTDPLINIERYLYFYSGELVR